MEFRPMKQPLCNTDFILVICPGLAKTGEPGALRVGWETKKTDRTPLTHLGGESPSLDPEDTM